MQIAQANNNKIAEEIVKRVNEYDEIKKDAKHFRDIAVKRTNQIKEAQAQIRELTTELKKAIDTLKWVQDKSFGMKTEDMLDIEHADKVLEEAVEAIILNGNTENGKAKFFKGYKPNYYFKNKDDNELDELFKWGEEVAKKIEEAE